MSNQPDPSEEKDQDVIDALAEEIAETVEEADCNAMFDLIQKLCEDGQ